MAMKAAIINANSRNNNCYRAVYHHLCNVIQKELCLFWTTDKLRLYAKSLCANGPPPESFIIYDESSAPSADDYLMDADYRLKPTFKKIQPRANGWAILELPKISTSAQKYESWQQNQLQLHGRLLLVLMGASICCAEAGADTQFIIFDLSCTEKAMSYPYPYPFYPHWKSNVLSLSLTRFVICCLT